MKDAGIAASDYINTILPTLATLFGIFNILASNHISI